MSTSQIAASEYGARPARTDVRPKLRPTRMLLSLLVSAASVFLAAGILPRFDVGDFWEALLAALVDRRAECGALAARRRDSASVHGGDVVPLAAPPQRSGAANHRRAHGGSDRRGRSRGGDPRGARHLRHLDRPGSRGGDERRRRLHAPRDPAHRPALRREGRDGRSRDRLPRDRRPREAGAPARDAGRQRIDDGTLARGRVPPTSRVGDRPLLPDGREPGGHPPRLERGHPGLPLGGEGARDR